MTRSSQTSRVSYAGDGTQTAFTIPFVFQENGDIVAVLREAAGAETAWTEATHYALSGAKNPSGGQLTVLTSPTDYTPASGETLVIRRVVPLTQETDYPSGGAFLASAHEDALDKLTDAAQQLQEQVSRSVTFPVTDDPAANRDLPTTTVRASKFLAFDTNGTPIAASGTSSDLGPVSSFVNTLLDDPDGAALLDTIIASASVPVVRSKISAQADVVTARGDIVRGSSTGAAERFALGPAGNALVSDGTDLAWEELSPRGYLFGLTLSNNGTDPNKDIDIAAGECRDDTDADFIRVTSPFTKRLDANWAAGTDQGGLDTSTVAADQTYHVWLIKRSDTGVVDALFSLSATSPSMPAAEWNRKRRIGAILTDASSNIIAFVQDGDHFTLANVTKDADTTASTSRVSYALTVPTGIKVDVLVTVVTYYSPAGSHFYGLLTSLDQTDTAPSSTFHTHHGIDGNTATGEWQLRTDISGQIGFRGTTSGTLRIYTMGWMDYRGRDN